MDPETDNDVSAGLQFVGLLITVVVIVAVFWLAIAILPSSNPPLGPRPNWLDYIVANRWVIWLIRLGGLAAMVMFSIFSIYFVRSITHRMRSGHWLRSGGPFHAEIVENALSDVEPLFQALSDADARNEMLDEALNDSNDLLQQLSDLLDRANAENAELRAELAAYEDHPPEG